MRLDSKETSGAWVTVQNNQYSFELNCPYWGNGKFLHRLSAIDEINGKPIKPGFFLVCIFNMDFISVIEPLAILDDLLAVKAGIGLENIPLKRLSETDKQKRIDIIDKVNESNPHLKDSIKQAIKEAVCKEEYVPDLLQAAQYDEEAKTIRNMEQLSPEDIEEVFDNISETLASQLDKYLCMKTEIYNLLIAELVTAQMYDTVKSDGKIDAVAFSDSLETLHVYSGMLLDEKLTATDNCKELISRQMPRVQFIYKDGKMVPRYYIRTVAEMFALDAYYYELYPDTYPFCILCGRYFIKRQRNTETYCDYSNNFLAGLTCREYHEQNPKEKDKITECTRRAVKSQNKYCSFHSDYNKAYVSWHMELKKRKHQARVDGNVQRLIDFIENTRFSNIGFADTDFSKY